MNVTVCTSKANFVYLSATYYPPTQTKSEMCYQSVSTLL